MCNETITAANVAKADSHPPSIAQSATSLACLLSAHSHLNPPIKKPKEGANKQVISSQADSLIKISRIWADF
ncbi:hypothetical protein D4N02_16670, partial [Klebsiella pneumoniae]